MFDEFSVDFDPGDIDFGTSGPDGWDAGPDATELNEDLLVDSALEAFRHEIGPTKGGEAHPDGCDRVPYFEEAYDLAASDPFKPFVHPDKNPLLQDRIQDLENRALHEFGGRMRQDRQKMFPSV